MPRFRFPSSLLIFEDNVGPVDLRFAERVRALEITSEKFPGYSFFI